MCKTVCEPLVEGSFMFKMFSIVMATVILALAALYFGGEYDTVNPSDRARWVRSVIEPDMSWQEVLERGGPPVRYGPASPRRPGGGGDSLDPTRLGTFNREGLEDHIALGTMNGGFVFYYGFAIEDAFWVIFDPAGRVKQVIDRQPPERGPLHERMARLL